LSTPPHIELYSRNPRKEVNDFIVSSCLHNLYCIILGLKVEPRKNFQGNKIECVSSSHGANGRQKGAWLG